MQGEKEKEKGQKDEREKEDVCAEGKKKRMKRWKRK